MNYNKFKRDGANGQFATSLLTIFESVRYSEKNKIKNKK